MIPNAKQHRVIMSGATESAQFGISAEDSAHIMTILRDTLYSDKILAVLREYSANAWDAHREVGKGDVPIKVTLPTDLEPTLKIRDYGTGLSPDAVFRVFTQYGKSTKRDDNKAVGMLGIGSKSGFSYADAFTITTWNGGQKYIYTAFLDESNLGMLSLLHQEACRGNDTGTEITIAIQKKDIHLFHDTARNLFQYFIPRPEINIALPLAIPNNEKLVHGIIRTDETNWVAIMGCVPYRVDMDQITELVEYDGDTISRFGGVLYFDIGTVEVNASREELKYSDRTKKALVQKFNDLVDEYVQHTLKIIHSSTETSWEKRLRAQDLNKIGLAPDGDLFAKWVVIKEDFLRNEFKLWRGSEMARTVNINEKSRIVIQDDFKRSLGGFSLQEYDYLVRPTDKTKNQETRDAVDAFILDLDIQGIPVINLSTLSWQPKRVNAHKEKNIKHHVKNFKFIPNTYYQKPYSQHWEAETEREATDDDIYVILQNFTSLNYSFFTLYSQDVKLAKVFNKTIPDVYGYKSTVARPVNTAPGKSYNQWSEEFRQSLMTDEVVKILVLEQQAQAMYRYFYKGYGNYYLNISDTDLMALNISLGTDHPISVFYSNAQKAKEELHSRSLDKNIIIMLEEIAKKANISIALDTAKDIKQTYQGFLDKYPLFSLIDESLLQLFEYNRSKWFDYIKLVDKNS